MRTKLTRPISVLTGAVLATTGLIATGAAPASAAAYPVWDVANVRAEPNTSAQILRVLPAWQRVEIDCYVNGQAVGDVGSTVWNHLTDGGYVADYVMDTGTNNPVVPMCGGAQSAPAAVPAPPADHTPASTGDYNRQAAVDWARAHWKGNAKYDQDCTWYASRALWAGGMGKTLDWHNLLHPPFDAVNADGLKNFLVNETKRATIEELRWSQNSVPDAELGDLIGYDFNSDGVLDHMMVVTNFSGEYPLVSGHTTDALDQGWTWSNAAKNWIQHLYTNPRAYLIHITQ